MPTTTPNTTTDFNITIALGKDGTPVTLSAKDLDSVKNNGLDFVLQQSVTVGTLQDFIDWFNTTFGTTIPDSSSGKDWPGPIKSIFDGVIGATIKVTTFEFHQPAKVGNSYPDPTYALVVTATAAKPVNFGIFSVIGGGIGVSNTPPATPVTPST